MSFQAYLDNIKTKTGKGPEDFKKLADKKLISYKPYQGFSLTAAGKKVALTVIRKHRLWELFLVEKLGFSWDQVDEIAEELEHIRSETLVEKLDNFLGKPRFDPHGDPIPDVMGNFLPHKSWPLSSATEKDTVTVTGVIDHQPSFLQFLASNNIGLGCKITIVEKVAYDQSMNITTNGQRKSTHISHEVAKNILVAI